MRSDRTTQDDDPGQVPGTVHGTRRARRRTSLGAGCYSPPQEYGSSPKISTNASSNYDNAVEDLGEVDSNGFPMALKNVQGKRRPGRRKSITGVGCSSFLNGEPKSSPRDIRDSNFKETCLEQDDGFGSVTTASSSAFFRKSIDRSRDVRRRESVDHLALRQSLDHFTHGQGDNDLWKYLIHPDNPERTGENNKKAKSKPRRRSDNDLRKHLIHPDNPERTSENNKKAKSKPRSRCRSTGSLDGEKSGGNVSGLSDFMKRQSRNKGSNKINGGRSVFTAPHPVHDGSPIGARSVFSSASQTKKTSSRGCREKIIDGACREVRQSAGHREAHGKQTRQRRGSSVRRALVRNSVGGIEESNESCGRRTHDPGRRNESSSPRARRRKSIGAVKESSTSSRRSPSPTRRAHRRDPVDALKNSEQEENNGGRRSESPSRRARRPNSIDAVEEPSKSSRRSPSPTRRAQKQNPVDALKSSEQEENRGGRASPRQEKRYLTRRAQRRHSMVA
jgi:hypothetical protein